VLSISPKLIENGYQVEIYDGNVDESLDNIKIDDDVVCVGVSTMIGHQIVGAIRFTEYVRSQRKVPIIWGGPLASVLPRIVLESGYPDYILRGSGDESFCKLVMDIDEGNEIDDYVGRSVCNKIKEGRIVFCNDRNRLPHYNYDIVQVENYIQSDPHIADRVLNYVSSQGCPFQCGFCTEVAIYDSKWSGCESKRIFGDVQFLCRKYNLTGIKFYDSNFFVNKQRVMEFIRLLLESDLNIKWAASAHPNNLKKYTNEEFELLAKSGLKRILIGAESGAQEELDFVKKEIKVQEIEELSYVLDKHKIRASFTFITGYPTFPESNVDVTLEFAKKLVTLYPFHEFKVHIFLPFPGSKLFNLSVENGFVVPTTLEEWSRLDYYEKCNPWVSEQSVERIRQFNEEFCPYVL
jgi:radical SAM superfamily enzyme YgiQ (UPF0313 family)